MFECTLKKKSSSCRLLLLFISLSLKVAQRQSSLPTQTSEGQRKGEMTNTSLKSQEIWPICSKTTTSRPSIFRANREGSQSSMSPFRAVIFLSPVVQQSCFVPWLIQGLKSVPGADISAMPGSTSLSFWEKSYLRRTYSIHSFSFFFFFNSSCLKLFNGFIGWK